MSLGIVVIGKDVNTLNTLLYRIDVFFSIAHQLLVISDITIMVKLCRQYKDLTTIESKRNVKLNKQIAIYALTLLDIDSVVVVENPLDINSKSVYAKVGDYNLPWTTYPESLAVLSDIQHAFNLNPPLLTSRSTYK